MTARLGRRRRARGCRGRLDRYASAGRRWAARRRGRALRGASHGLLVTSLAHRAQVIHLAHRRFTGPTL